MAVDDIQGTVTDSGGNPVSGAVVYLFNQDSPNVVESTTTDANGDYIFEDHTDGDGTSQNWYVTAYYDDGSQLYNTLSKPQVSSSLPSPSTIPDSGVSRWTFDDADTSGSTALDSWGSNDGTINGATTGASGANQTYTTNEAYSFDGTDDDVNCGTSTAFQDLTQGDFTIAFWFKTTGTSTHSVAVDIGEGDRSKWVAFDNFDGGDEFSFNIDDGSSRVSVSRTPKFTDDSWHHAVGLRNSGTMQLYIDNSSVGTASQPSQFSINGTFLIGNSNVGEPWTGEIDDVRVYDKALSNTEVSNLYNTGSING